MYFKFVCDERILTATIIALQLDIDAGMQFYQLYT
jgi:hypothetical protein